MYICPRAPARAPSMRTERPCRQFQSITSNVKLRPNMKKYFCDACGNEIMHGVCHIDYDFYKSEESLNGYTSSTTLKGHKDICLACLCKMADSVGMKLETYIRQR